MFSKPIQSSPQRPQVQQLRQVKGKVEMGVGKKGVFVVAFTGYALNLLCRRSIGFLVPQLALELSLEQIGTYSWLIIPLSLSK